MNAKLLFVIFSCLTLAPSGLLAHGDLHEQIEKLTRQIGSSPTAALYLKRGELHREHEDQELALADYDKAAELDPGLEVIDWCRGMALADAGQPARAREALDRFLLKQPDHADGHLTRARVLATLKEHDPAAKDYRRALQLSSEPRPETYLELSQVLEQAGDPAAAIAALDDGIGRVGAIPTLQTAAIELELEEKRHESALKRADQLVAAAERKETWLALRAEILTRAGRPAEARQALRDSLSSIEALPARIRELAPTLELEAKVRSALSALGPG
jgi:tetratricopeptide (TPR) repeat protein